MHVAFASTSTSAARQIHTVVGKETKQTNNNMLHDLSTWD